MEVLLMQPKLKELIQIREEEMMEVNCSYDTFKRYRRYWNEFLNYSEKHGYQFYNGFSECFLHLIG